MQLPINIEHLLRASTVESERIEFKAGWNPDAVYRAVCAFANDFDNSGGGYILLGVEEKDGRAGRPVKGLPENSIDKIQREMIGFNNLIRPLYSPKFFLENVDSKPIGVIWVPGGAERPYEVPENVTSAHKNRKYFIRRYSSTIEAKGADKNELFSLANRVPFDDRANTGATLDDISITRLRDHLRVVHSRLHEVSESLSKKELLAQMDLLSGPVEAVFPRNVALMLFSDCPAKFFPYTYIDVVHFPRGRTAPFTEKQFKGPVQLQIQHALSFIQANVLVEKVTKVPGRAEAERNWNYPFPALEEVVANSIYHREYPEREPVTIRIEEDRIIVHNLGGPDRSVRMRDLSTGHIAPKRYRNRRLGDFLKELELTEGRATGISSIVRIMRENGSPDPMFRTDEGRTWFEVTLPVHPAFSVGKKAILSEPEVHLLAIPARILRILEQRPAVKIAEIAELLGVSRRTVDKHLAQLRQKGKVERLGSLRSGFWKVR